MVTITKEEIRKLVLEVLSELNRGGKARSPSQTPHGPRVLIIFQAGVRRLEDALKQLPALEAAAGWSGVYTAPSARSWVCGSDVRNRAGTPCILDTVKPEGLEKVLARADWLVLPTLCLTVASKVAHLSCDDPESRLVFSALIQGKKVLACRDGFMVCDLLVNQAIKEEIENQLKKLERFGMTFCPTHQLAETFVRLTTGNPLPGSTSPSEVSEEKNAPGLELITAKEVRLAAEGQKKVIRLVPGGLITPLARDLIKELGIVVDET
ncbi:MAG: hypothetical protein HY879_19095 [Deltaproteobacteria bacterium]|nr:hypothetical protein [Deltaproteobacteria bacterium]